MDSLLKTRHAFENGVLKKTGKSGNEAWLGEVLQDPVVLGYQATDAMYHALVLGETLPDKYDLPEPEAITPANIADYAWQSWGWLG